MSGTLPAMGVLIRALMAVIVTAALAPAVALAYVRPLSATPVRVPLVPAYQACTAPNRTHGPPLEHPSCNPPLAASGQLTVGSPDANALPANAIGVARFSAVGAPGDPDDSDVMYRLTLTDVREAGDPYPDYAGELQATTTARVTDRHNGLLGDEPATVSDFAFPVTVPCMPTPEPVNVGSMCVVTTTFDTVIPGAIPEGKRSVWELDQVEVFDGGDDGDAETEEDNTLFAVQGVYVP